MSQPAPAGGAIAMWSGPRNISTAMMRAWENRDDCVVWDEPLYAYYLARTGIDHPGADEIIAAGESDWRQVVTRCTGPVPGGHAFHFQKHMTHHVLDEMDVDWLAELNSYFLIRDPREVIASYARVRERVTVKDVGIPQQAHLFDHVTKLRGSPPPVVDSRDVLSDPQGVLRALCHALDVPFRDAMLHWPEGPRDSDGVWARFWYASVEQSTGFAPYQARQVSLSSELSVLAEQCMGDYERLHATRIRS